MRLGSWLALAPALLLCSCGYHTAGHVVQLPESVKTIAVPAFKNETTTYRIEQMLTSSVVREFTTRTHYRILNDPGSDADATLVGTVLSTSTSPLAYDTATGRALGSMTVTGSATSLFVMYVVGPNRVLSLRPGALNRSAVMDWLDAN